MPDHTVLQILHFYIALMMQENRHFKQTLSLCAIVITSSYQSVSTRNGGKTQPACHPHRRLCSPAGRGVLMLAFVGTVIGIETVGVICPRRRARQDRVDMRRNNAAPAARHTLALGVSLCRYWRQPNGGWDILFLCKEAYRAFAIVVQNVRSRFRR